MGQFWWHSNIQGPCSLAIFSGLDGQHYNTNYGRWLYQRKRLGLGQYLRNCLGKWGYTWILLFLGSSLCHLNLPFSRIKERRGYDLKDFLFHWEERGGFVKVRELQIYFMSVFII